MKDIKRGINNMYTLYEVLDIKFENNDIDNNKKAYGIIKINGDYYVASFDYNNVGIFRSFKVLKYQDLKIISGTCVSKVDADSFLYLHLDKDRMGD
jgi:hypothetical protein